jgi:oligopeptide/dipeptide ABC transporter ATP-binding protein
VLLEVSNLRVEFGPVAILGGVDFTVDSGKTLGVVGESGCGKSMTGRALMGMTPEGGSCTGSIKLEGRELVGLPEREWQKIRGLEIAMVMQDPFTSLNPVMKVGHQIGEVYELHQGLSRREAWGKAVEMLNLVGIPDPESAAHKYPHQMSGGQRQRVVIAIAFGCQPKLLIADEPTTALDVTLQAQILKLLKSLQKQYNTGVVMISHDIGVIAEESDEIAVFYAGEIVERGPTVEVLQAPAHPYTRALLGALPTPGKKRLDSISGQPPRFDQLPEGCNFGPRCKYFGECCRADQKLIGEVRFVRCCRAQEP